LNQTQGVLKEIKSLTISAGVLHLFYRKVTVLVAGSDCSAVAEQASKVANVSKVLLCQDPSLAKGLAENMSVCAAAAAKSAGRGGSKLTLLVKLKKIA